MRIIYRLAPLFVAMIFFACNRNYVKLDYTNAKGEVQPLQNFVFRFSSSLIKDSLLNNWDSTDYISFEPKIPGRFRWESPDQLVFSPSAPLAPATTYKAKISSEVLRYSKYDKVKAGDISFHTPDLNLDNAQVIWTLQDEQSRMAVPQVDLYFNYAIDPATVKEKLKLDIEGKKTDFTVVTTSPSDKISVRVTGLAKPEDKNYDTKITLEKGR
jgi:hypothetical protein